MTLVSWFDPANDAAVVQELGDRDVADVLATAFTIGSPRGLPAVEFVRPDQSVLTLGTDGQSAVVVWTNSLGENANSVGDGNSTNPLVYDYFGSWSEAPAGWLTPLANAVECVRAFLRSGTPNTDEVTFSMH